MRAYDAVMSRMRQVRWCIGAAAVSCAAACAAGCAAARPAHGSAEHSRPAAGAGRRDLATRYLVIARAGNRRLEIDLDGLAGRDHNHLAAAQADLRDAAATERLFDRRLLQIPFPARIEATARRLYRVNQSRAALTAAAAAAASLRDLHADEPVLTAANRPVEQAVQVIRRQLRLPPPGS